MNKNEINLRKLQKVNSSQIPFVINKDQTSFKVVIQRFITDVDGKLKDKNTLPDFAQTKYPVWLFGNFDLDGGYFIGKKLFPLDSGLFYLYTATVGKDLQLLNFSGTNNVKEKLETGDQVYIFSNSPQFPSFFVWIVIKGGRRSYSSILSNPLSKGIDVFMIKYFVDNNIQFNQTLSMINFDEIGNYKTFPIPPLRYKTTDYQQDKLIDLVLPYKISNYSGLYFYMDFRSDAIEMIFRYKLPLNK